MAIDDETLNLGQALRITIGDEVGARTRQLVRAWARTWREVYIAWVDAIDELEGLRDPDGSWPTPAQIARAQRAQRALLSTTDEVRELAAVAGVTITDGVGKMVDIAAEYEDLYLRSQMPRDPEIRAALGVRFNRMDPASLDRIVRRTTEQVTSLLWPLAAQANESMYRTLVAGVALGRNPRTAAREMLRRVEGAFNGGLTRALVIARTEMLDAYRWSSWGTRILNEDLVKGWVWVSTLDTRTCPSCWAMHGTEHDREEWGPDDHHQGRCTSIPLLKTWQELGIDLEEPTSVLPDAQARFADLPRADQLAVMGPARLDLLQSGKVAWSDLSTTRSAFGWRDSRVPTPVRDLRDLADPSRAA